MARVVLDSGAVIALSRGDSRARAVIARSVRDRDYVVVPAVVVAETTRGRSTDAVVNRVLKAIDAVPPATEPVARTAGRLLGRTRRTTSTVDALIAAEAALNPPAVVVTSDVHDLRALLDGVPGTTVVAFEAR